jgi:hypothetical protein
MDYNYFITNYLNLRADIYNYFITNYLNLQADGGCNYLITN